MAEHPTALTEFLDSMAQVHRTGLAVPETSYYPALDKLLSTVGSSMSPPVYSVTQISGKGSSGSKNTGIPDLGLFCDSAGSVLDRDLSLTERLPERGVVEVKPPGDNLDLVVKAAQVGKYLQRYGKVLVTNLREWRLLRLGDGGKRVESARVALADDEAGFWAIVGNPALMGEDVHEETLVFLLEALHGEASVSRVDDLARYMGSQAKRAMKKIDEGNIDALQELRQTLETGLGLRFEGDDGDRFFKSTLVQSLFYGVFSAWVLWHRKEASTGSAATESFNWRESQWHLRVPVVQALFRQIADPSLLKPMGLDLILDGTQQTLDRVDTERFFAKFDATEAVQYFYEPFVGYFDPELRKQYGVWYTPPEIVQYMVDHVDEALRTKLGIEAGLADESVWVLDPCVGTGSFLMAVADKVAESLRQQDGLSGQDLKKAVTKRLIGFELLPAPFIVSHLQLGLKLALAGAPLADDERAAVYLTNSLTGWNEEAENALPLREFEEERKAATEVKQKTPVLVVLGNPPYNGYAGVSTEEEADLIAPYRENIETRNSLGDLYVRFLRIAERQIAERSERGLVCYISNFSYLHEPGFVTMRDHLRASFDEIYIDNLNGDSRETGKKTPDGDSDPSVFSTKFNKAGIQTGTAISLMIRHQNEESRTESAEVNYREFWGKGKRAELAALAASDTTLGGYEGVDVRDFDRRSFRPSIVADDYSAWTQITDLASFVELGLNENRGSVLIDPSKDEIVKRMRAYLDPKVELAAFEGSAIGPLSRPYAGFDPERTRKLLQADGFDASKVRRVVSGPMDYQWAYVEASHKLWNRSRPELLRHVTGEAKVLLVRNRAPRLKDGVPILPATALANQHAMHKDAYHIPIRIASEASAAGGMFADATEPNLSPAARSYLSSLGIDPAEDDYATVLWDHCLAISSAPLYEEENTGGIATDWPRIPLPDTADMLRASAGLGARVWALLDPLMAPDAVLPRVAAIRSTRPGGQLNPDAGDLEVRAEWSRLQQGTKVMPGRGRTTERSPEESEANPLGSDTVVDVYLNDIAYWPGIPKEVWDLKIGGFQVLKKWLSYREHGPDEPTPLLGRSISIDEAREFTEHARRLTAYLALSDTLNGNYDAVRNNLASLETGGKPKRLST